MFKESHCSGDIGADIQRPRMKQSWKGSGQAPKDGTGLTKQVKGDKNKI